MSLRTDDGFMSWGQFKCEHVMCKNCFVYLCFVQKEMKLLYRHRGRWGSTRRGGWWGWGSPLYPRRWPHRTSLCHCRTHRSDMAPASTHPGLQTPGRPECSFCPCLRGATQSERDGKRQVSYLNAHADSHAPTEVSTLVGVQVKFKTRAGN